MPSPKGCPQIGVVLPRLLLVSQDFDQIPIFLLPPSSNALPPHGPKHFLSKQRCKLVPTQNYLSDFTELQRQYVATTVSALVFRPKSTDLLDLALILHHRRHSMRSAA
jgi:hypothetical protein